MSAISRRLAGSGRTMQGLVLVLALCTPAAASSGKNDDKGSGNRSAKISSKVTADAKKSKDNKGKGKGKGKVDVLVRFRAKAGANKRSVVGAVGGVVRREYASEWMAVQMPAGDVEKLAESTGVDYVASDPAVWAAMDASREAAGQPAADRPESSLEGDGVTIAMIDSGVALHPEIQTLVAAVDFVRSLPVTAPETSIDPNGHGTHVAGILVGNGSHSQDQGLAGVAPAAQLVSLRVLDQNGSGRASDMLAALDWVRTHKDEYGIRVLNLSLGHPVYEAAANDPLVQAVEALWDAGVVVVCSAGNLGREGHGTITSPCNARKVITVGALNDRGTFDRTDDTVTTYSSRGPTVIDGVAKPDLLAPGNRIVSARAPGSFLDLQFPERRRAEDPANPLSAEHYEMSGTSMAAPMVAGAAALLIEQEPTLDPASVKARLMLSARKASIGDPFATGAGSLDILAALQTSGTVGLAPSPRAFPGGAGTLTIEDTATLWANPAFALQALWSTNVLWSAGQPQAGLLSSDGVLYPETSANATLWPEAALWPEATLWPESTLWSESVLWSDETLDAVGSLGVPVVDP